MKVLAKELKEKEDDDVESITEALLTAPVLEVLKVCMYQGLPSIPYPPLPPSPPSLPPFPSALILPPIFI